MVENGDKTQSREDGTLERDWHGAAKERQMLPHLACGGCGPS